MPTYRVHIEGLDMNDDIGMVIECDDTEFTEKTELFNSPTNGRIKEINFRFIGKAIQIL
jgi:hypothetical protein